MVLGMRLHLFKIPMQYYFFDVGTRMHILYYLPKYDELDVERKFSNTNKKDTAGFLLDSMSILLPGVSFKWVSPNKHLTFSFSLMFFQPIA